MARLRRLPELNDHPEHRLGRHVNHDDRSRAFVHLKAGPLVNIRHDMKVPIMDQGDLGSCTGHAAVAALGSPTVWMGLGDVTKQDLADVSYAHSFAEQVYSAATKIDPWDGEWPDNDTGSDGLSASKALVKMGFLSGYTHAFSLQDCLDALCDRAVYIGIKWLAGCDSPSSLNGLIRYEGSVRGGHEICLDELDVDNQLVWFRNSWGEGWGVYGRACMLWADLEKALLDDGDVTIPFPATETKPKPVYDDEWLAAVSKTWRNSYHSRQQNVVMAHQLRLWDGYRRDHG